MTRIEWREMQALISNRAGGGFRRMRPMLAGLVLAAAFVAFAAEKNGQESCFLAITFANGNTASIQLSNTEKKAATVNIERYSANGSLLDKVRKTLPAGRKCGGAA